MNYLQKYNKKQLSDYLADLEEDRELLRREKFWKNKPIDTPWHDSLINKIKQLL